MKRRVVMSRLVSRKALDRRFDLAFWRRVGTQGKFAAAWDMVRELIHWNPRHGDQQRLRRSVAVLQRRPRLLRAKQGTGRLQDQLDLQLLAKAPRRRHPQRPPR